MYIITRTHVMMEFYGIVNLANRLGSITLYIVLFYNNVYIHIHITYNMLGCVIQNQFPHLAPIRTISFYLQTVSMCIRITYTNITY